MRLICRDNMKTTEHVIFQCMWMRSNEMIVRKVQMPSNYDTVFNQNSASINLIGGSN